MSKVNRQGVILLVEDDEDDIEFFNSALDSLQTSFALDVVTNGSDVLDRLNSLHAKNSLPCLIILDVNLPGLNGKEVFKLIRHNPNYANIPIVIFTTSSSPTDKNFFLSNHAEFFTKPPTIQAFTYVVERIASFCEK